MGMEVYIEPLQRTKEREEFYKKWTLEQVDNAKYYEELREVSEESIEFYIDISDEGELELLEKNKNHQKLSKYWSGFYWFAVRNMLGEKQDYEYAKEQFKKEKDILNNLQEKTHDKNKRLSLLIRMSSCALVKHRMGYVLNESVYLPILQEYNQLELEHEFIKSWQGVQVYGDIGYDVLSVLGYSGYDRFFVPLERKHFEKLSEKLGDNIINKIGLNNIEEIDFENYMWFMTYNN